MKYLNESMQAIVMIVCDKHVTNVRDKLKASQVGNWFVMPPAATCLSGYWPNVSESHSCQGCAIMGFAETQAMTRLLEELASYNDDGSLCPDCVAYEWNITPSHVAATAHDLVCHRAVACSNSVSHNHNGELFFFCSVGCRDEFQKSPQKYIGATSKPLAGVAK